MIFPPNTTHIGVFRSGTTIETLIPADSENPISVLSVRMEEDGTVGGTVVQCGTQAVAGNKAGTSYSIDYPAVVCTDDLRLYKTSTDDLWLSLNYAPYNIHEATAWVVPTSQPFTLEPSFTFGETTIALLLIPLLTVALYQTIMQAFRKPIVWHK